MAKVTRARMCLMTLAGLTAVLPACSGHVEIPKVDVSSLSPQDQFLDAAARGDVGKLESLLATDPALMDARGQEGMTPLHCAAFNGQTKAVQFLMERGADPLAGDENGNSALNTALAEGHKDTAKIIQDAVGRAGTSAAAQ